MSVFYGLVHPLFAFLFNIGNQYSSAYEHESDQILNFPYVFSENQSAEYAGENGLREFYDKQIRKLSVFYYAVPNAIADDRCGTNINHYENGRAEGEVDSSAHRNTDRQKNSSAEKLRYSRRSDGRYFQKNLFAYDVGKNGAK